jgi:outer membrane protein OmpA-like peptidoglycan-associated protein
VFRTSISKIVTATLLAMPLVGLTTTTANAAVGNVSNTIQVARSSIANGQAQTVTFQAAAQTWLSANSGNRMFCLYVDGTRETRNAPTSSNPNQDITAIDPSFDPTGYQESVLLGVVKEVLNKNSGALIKTYKWIAIEMTAIGQDCSSLSVEETALATNNDVDAYATAASWIVTPAISSPASQTLIVGVQNSTPVSLVTNSLDVALNVVDGSYWEQAELINCNPSLPETQLDLSALGLTLVTTTSASGTVAPLVMQGTPVAGSAGDYQLCLKIEGNRSAIVLVDLTISATPPAVAATCTKKSLGNVKFGADSAKLSKAAKKKLNAYAKTIKASGCKKITLNGYASTTSDYSKIYKRDRVGIAKERNKVVATYLASQFKKIGAKVTIKKVNMAGKNPVASNKNEKGRSQNRRVEIVLTP